MFTVMVLNVLPRDYDNVVTVLNYGEQKDYEAMKQDLINYANSRPTATTSAFQSGGTGNQLKCFKCKKGGHRQSECTDKTT